ncbi:beta-2 adrenergic receptor-like [Xenia sp. Carnegie-2017]|uniref:beta-2 adrenergic receptor-like n=1 Tax=Xenia sp. Carnegie-2017 TaxID=2897299 RepID=UPI001F03416F|nr:beta-2 adrenergic receptor-like [Xenia sp. Carnegie-2017]
MNPTNKQIPQTFGIFLITFESLFIIIGVTGNVFVIWHNVRWNKDKNTTSYFVTNLALSDLVVCGITIPMVIAKNTLSLMGKTGLPCELFISILCASISLSVVNLMMLTIDRYICIAFPLKYPHIVTKRKVSIALASVWITGFLYYIMIFFTTRATDVLLLCDVNKIAGSVGIFFFFFVPLGVTIVFNVKTVQIARSQGQKIAAQASLSQTNNSTSADDLNSRKNFSRQMKLFKTIRVVFGCFLLCVTPFPVIRFIKFVICNHACIPLKVLVGISLLAATNSITNAFIYGIRDKKYRRSFKQMFARCCNLSG